MGGGGGGRREVEGDERVEDEKMTQVDGRQGLSPLVPPVPVVVSATVVAAPVAAVVPVGRVLVLMALVMVGMLCTSACMDLATRAVPVADVVAAATS